MEDIMKDVNIAFQMISSIAVAGDAVDSMAVARAKLKDAYQKLEVMQNETDNKTSEVT
jgi:hypothetical protein